MNSIFYGLHFSGKVSHKSLLNILLKLLWKCRFSADQRHEQLSPLKVCINSIDEIIKEITQCDLSETSVGKEQLLRACFKLKNENLSNTDMEFNKAIRIFSSDFLKSKELDDLILATTCVLFCECIKVMIQFDLDMDYSYFKQTLMNHLHALNISERFRKVFDSGSKLFKMASNEEKRLERLNEILIIHFQINIIFGKLCEFAPDLFDCECVTLSYNNVGEKSPSSTNTNNYLNPPKRSDSMVSLTSIRRSNSNNSLVDTANSDSNFIFVNFPIKHKLMNILQLADYSLKKDKNPEIITELVLQLTKCFINNFPNEENLIFSLFATKDYEYITQSLDNYPNAWTAIIWQITQHKDLSLLELFTCHIFDKKEFRSRLSSVQWNDIIISLINEKKFAKLKLLPWRFSSSLCDTIKKILNYLVMDTDDDYSQCMKAIIEGSDLINDLPLVDISHISEGGTCTASSFLFSSQRADCLFLDDDSDSWFSDSLISPNTQFIIRELSSPVSLVGIALKQRFKCYQENFPAQYSLSATNSDLSCVVNTEAEWITLLEISDLVLENEEKWHFHPLEQKEPFKTYKLEIKETLCSKNMKVEPIVITQLKMLTSRFDVKL